ncbi:MAG: hypothetical protein Tsb0013_06040 [Phycisphaerales bacterium]
MVVVAFGACSATAAPEYVATDITGWSQAELETLPFTRRWVPFPPAGAPATFELVAHQPNGLACADGPTGIGGQTHAYRIDGASYGGLSPFGQHSWGYWSFDGQDYHYYFGYVHYTHARDMNYAGDIVGVSTISGSSDYSSGARYHAFRWTVAGEMIDLTPGAAQANASAINNRGEVTGWERFPDFSFNAFRILPDGSKTLLDELGGAYVYPSAINASGVIVGQGGGVPCVGVSGASVVAIGLPDEGDFEVGSAYEINDAGWIVGAGWTQAQPYEHFAALWEPGGVGVWTPFALNELCITPDILLENPRAIAEDGSIICTGRPDGSDALGSRLYLLTPTTPVAQACAPDIGVHPTPVVEACAGTGLTLTIELARDDPAADFRWLRDGVDLTMMQSPGVLEGADTTSLTLFSPDGADSGVYTCEVTNACGVSASNPSQVVVVVCCPADFNNDGLVDLGDFGALGAAFDSSLGDANYNPDADFDNDGDVDLGDFGVFGTEFGRSDC